MAPTSFLESNVTGKTLLIASAITGVTSVAVSTGVAYLMDGSRQDKMVKVLEKSVPNKAGLHKALKKLGIEADKEEDDEK